MFFEYLLRRRLSLFKRIAVTALSLILCCALSALAATQAHCVEQNTPTQRTQAASPAQLRVAYIPYEGIFNDTYNSSKYLQELFQILTPYLKHTALLVPTTIDDQAAIYKSYIDEVNVIALIAPSTKRAQQLVFSKNPIADSEVFLVTDVDKEIYHEDKKALHGKTVAIFADNSVALDILREYLVKHNIHMDIQVYELYEEYLYSHADFHLANSFYFPEDKQIVASIGTQSLHFAAIPEKTYFVNALDKALEQAITNDADKIKALYSLHMQKRTLALGHEVTRTETQYLDRNTRKTSVAYFATHYPIQYMDEENNFKGITADVLEIFRQMRSHPSAYTPYTPHKGVDVKAFDMLLSIVGNRETKEKYFNVSQTYASLPMVLFERIANTKHSFGMLDYSSLSLEAIQQAFPHWDMHIFTTFDEMLAAYKKKSICAMLMSNVEAEYIISLIGLAGNEVTATSFALPLHFYLSKAFPPEAMNILNAYIDKLSPDAVQRIVVAAGVAIRAPATVTEFIAKHWLPLSLLATTFLFFVCAIYAERILRERKNMHDIINIDKLTGLSSQAHAFEIMHKTLQRAQAGQYIIFCIDIDNFTLLNQVYGREKAAEILCFLGKMFEKKYLHNQGAECVARLSSDLFLVFTKTRPLNENYDTLVFHEEVIAGVRNILQNTYTIGLSRGSYIIDDPSLPIETMIYYCNAARRQGKHVYGMTTANFTADMANEIHAQQEVLCRMEAALLNEEFTLIFQPKVSLQNMQICGAEVLLRWLAPDGPIYPDAFIPVFESNAFIAHLDMYVFDKTCEFISRHRSIIGAVPLAINLSGMTVLHNETYERICRSMEKYGVSAREIEIELTESALVNESTAFIQAIESFSRLGFKIAIDDFGTGVSSLHRLSAMRVDVVKLDKSFLDTRLPKKRGSILVESIIDMLHKLNIKVVAEGVETQHQVGILQKMQCDIVQGYYFYKPKYEKEFIEVLTQAESYAKKRETHAA